MRALIIFIRNPVRGKVKTRLALSAGEDKALEIYQELLAHTRQISVECRSERLLFYSDFLPEKDEWPDGSFRKLLQKGDDLGERMAHAFRLALSGNERAIIIGSDCAALSSAMLEEAFTQLEQWDTVIGPALDGGYYLLGAKTFYPELFRGISWGSPQVLSQTLSVMRRKGLSCCLLPPLPDIDTEEDWLRYGSRL